MHDFIINHPGYVLLIVVNLVLIVWSIGRLFGSTDRPPGGDGGDDGGFDIDNLDLDLPPGVVAPIDLPDDQLVDH